MKKSVLTILKELKENLDKEELVVLGIHREGKQPIVFTITSNSIKANYPRRKNNED